MVGASDDGSFEKSNVTTANAARNRKLDEHRRGLPHFFQLSSHLRQRVCRPSPYTGIVGFGRPRVGRKKFTTASMEVQMITRTIELIRFRFYAWRRNRLYLSFWQFFSPF